PLVAFLNKRETNHQWAANAFQTFKAPLRTCESVISEACFLLRNKMGGSDALMEMLDRKAVKVDFNLNQEYERVRQLMKRYADTPMSLADACLVRMSELMTDCEIVTLDNDFEFYRRNGRQKIPLRIP
ncbi:MAG: PIN domain-containing protein, partial [Gammaproteobacteria bacterium]|nr:PIN domain-containing protein [Gammaproteobacteria bacterium]